MSRGKFRRGSRSANSAKLFDVRISVVRLGIDLARVGCMLLTRLRARRSVRSLGESGKLDMAVMSLSVKSIASWSYRAYGSVHYRVTVVESDKSKPSQLPDFQWLVFCGLQSSYMISMELASKSSICPFQSERTSKIQLTFFDWIQVRQRSLNEFRCKPHD